MNPPRIFLATLCILLLSAVLFSGVSDGASGSREWPYENQVASVTISPDRIDWMPFVDYAGLVLRVSAPDGSVYQQSFNAGSTPSIEISGSLPDGLYTYELRFIPFSNKVRDDIETAGEDTLPQKALIQSGNFSVRGGSFVMSQNEGGLSIQDVLHYDDVVITGSLCVGFDCQNGESFGYDTIKLKENNLRIYFEDTSVGSFPTNDWRIVVNDSTSGGASYFAVEDSTGGRTPFRIEAGAPSNALYVEDYGRVGLGTSIPSVELHIVDGDTPTVRLDQDGSGGWTAQVWDVAGNETNFFVRDVTNGSKLPFRIQPGAPSSTLTFKSDGKVGIGTWSPEFPLELETTGVNAIFQVERTDGVKFKLAATATQGQVGTRTNHKLNFTVNNSAKMTIGTDGYVGIGDTTPDYPLDVQIANGAHVTAGGVWTNGSSREYKENIEDLTTEEAMDALEGLSPVKFH